MPTLPSQNCALSPCLTILPSLQKLFVVPADEAQARIPYARVNHNKYMVTERATYIGKCPQYHGHIKEGSAWALGPGHPSDPYSTPCSQEPPIGLEATSQRQQAPPCW